MFDPSTLALALALVVLMSAGGTVTTYLLNREVLGVKYWAIAMVVAALSVMESMAMGIGSIFSTGGAVLLGISYVYASYGFRAYAGLRNRFSPLMFVMPILLVGIAIYLIFDPIWAKIGLVVCMAIIASIVSFHALSKLFSKASMVILFGAGIWLVHGLVNLWLLYLLAIDNYTDLLFGAISFEALYSIEMLGFVYCLTLTFIVMTTEHLQKQLQEQAHTDSLTGLYNRRAFSDFVNHAIGHSVRTGESLSLMMLDLDRFKLVNDKYGHQAGDLVLKNFAKCVGEQLRGADVMSRHGGEEFLILLPDADRDDAKVVGERILDAWRNYITKYDRLEVRNTVSIGCVSKREGSMSLDTLTQEADATLYEAKNTGRDKMVQI